MTTHIQLHTQERIAHIVFDQPHSPVNTMCEAWQHDLHDVAAQVKALHADGALAGVVLRSNKTTFFAGADLRATMALTPADAPRVFDETQRIKHSFRTIETLGIPVVSCINGAALGGGWEVALVGHYRIAINDPRIQLGLPEVSLGLFPGASGATKMSRLLGLLKAQPYVVQGTLFNPSQAFELGLVHQLIAPSEHAATDMLAAAKTWIEANPTAQHPFDEKGYRMPGGTAASPALANALSVAPAMLLKQTRGLLPAPEYALASMVEGSLVDIDTALRIESRYLAKLITTPVARNMINTFFFDMNAIKSARSRPQAVAKQKLTKVGVVGAGMMGAGIAYAQASKGIETTLIDVSQDAANAGKAHSDKLLRARVAKGQLDEAAARATLARITATTDMAALDGSELIIEAVFENRALKASITQASEPYLAAGGVMASNTSTLPISGLAQASARAAMFVGIHFFSPVHKMKLVEIIRGKDTSDHAIALAFDYVQQLGKLPIVVNDSRGFFTSRTFGTYVMEGAAMLGEGVPAALLENAAMQCGMPVGPLAVLDETALSLSVAVLDQTRADFAASGQSYEASAGELLVERMVKELHRPGRAAGGGFYDYPANAPKHLWPQLEALFTKPDTAAPSVQAIQDRLLFRQAVETARCLHEGVLQHVHDANIGSIMGIGFPVWTGGAAQFIYSMGVDTFAQRCHELAQLHGAGFAIGSDIIATLKAHTPTY
jgi:3-hydroxyacyl-CoA dehydrogenase / enoyl-CoA hydratase / 3-hydroxybutyryl-CoA epimerase